MVKIFIFILLAVVMALLYGALGIAGDEASPQYSPGKTAVTPQSVPAKPEVTPEIKSPENVIPLSERKDIILLSKFYRGMNDDDVPEGWDLDDKKEPIDISLVKEGEQFAVCFKSEASAFGLYNEQDFDIKDYPILNWEWKVTKLPDGGNFLDEDKDDQAAQVYVSFGSLSFFNKPFVKAVGYYWSSTLPIGTEGECPTWSKSRAIVIETGEEKLGEWITEKRNVYQDYEKLFEDDDPSDVSALRLYTNSQHTETGTEAFFRNIYFSKN
jgi:Protein of unknown function (DUF3047)